DDSLKNLGIERLDVFCMSRVDPHIPVEESVGAMAEFIKEGKTRFISLSECSAQSLKRGSAVHPLASLQMEYSLFSRDAEQQGQIAACRELHGDDGLWGGRARHAEFWGAAAGGHDRRRHSQAAAALSGRKRRRQHAAARGA